MVNIDHAVFPVIVRDFHVRLAQLFVNLWQRDLFLFGDFIKKIFSDRINAWDRWTFKQAESRREILRVYNGPNSFQWGVELLQCQLFLAGPVFHGLLNILVHWLRKIPGDFWEKFAQMDTVPLGVQVLLGLVPQSV